MRSLLAFLVPITALLAQQVQMVGGGNGWLWEGRKVPRDLPATATLTGTASSDIILKCGESAMLSYTCAQEQCKVPVCANDVPLVKVKRVDPGAWAAKPQASLGRILSAYFARTPNSVETLGVRAAGNLTDAVVHQIGDKVQWRPALLRVLEGSYCFQLSRLPVRAESKPILFQMTWDPEDKGNPDGAAPVPHLDPGTYTLRRGTPTGAECSIDDPDAAPAWVLVAPDPAFDAVNAEWRSYSSDLASLAESDHPEVAATLRHAMLAYLADSLGK